MAVLNAAAIDWDLLIEKLEQLKDPKAGPVDIPVYDFVTHSRHLFSPHCNLVQHTDQGFELIRLSQTSSVYGADVILLEGILIFHRVSPPHLFIGECNALIACPLSTGGSAKDV